MTTARVLITQGAEVYRFMRFETSADGSLLAILDRDARSKRGAMTLKDGVFVPDEPDSEAALPSARYSIHTTGEVHRYAAGKRQNSIHIEPLYALTKIATIGIISIPGVSRLDKFDEKKHRHDVSLSLHFPEEVSERITFLLELGPRLKQAENGSYGVMLNYELYSATIRLAPPQSIPVELKEHFIHGMPKVGQYPSRQVDRATAELSFYHGIHGVRPIVFRDNNGGYIMLAETPMRIAPRIRMGFDREDLYIEQLPFEGSAKQPSHKVRFLIYDKGGKNKRDDLRGHITSIELDARL